jgi:Zn-dependent protease
MDMPNEQLLFGLIWYMVFILTITFHEAAHALAAKLLGDPTAYYGGQVTLNPLPHIQREPFGTILMPALSYMFTGWMMGWASAPYDPFWAARYPRRAALMALAGPLANLLLVFLAIGLVRLAVATGAVEQLPSLDDLVIAALGRPSELPKPLILLGIVLFLNLLLFFFNLLPLPPLDGSAVIQLLMRNETALRWQMAMRQPHFAMLGMIAAWAVFSRVWPTLYGAFKLVFWPDVA